MAKLLMITGLGSAVGIASNKKGAFYNTLEEFHKYWERIDIIAPKPPRGSTSGRFEVEPLFGNVFIHISPWPLVFHPVWFIKKGLEIYREQKFDLMTVQEFPPFYNGIGARLLWQKVKVPYVLEIFHIPGHPRASSIKESVYRFLFKLFIKLDSSKAKAIRVMNQGQVPNFLVRAGVPRHKIIYIPAIYVDTDVFKPMNLSKEYDLIFVGRLEKNKGVELLLKAIKLMAHDLSPLVKCLIVGEGSLKKELEQRTMSYELNNNVFFHGFAKDSREISELLNKSKILVMPSYNEGGPRVVVEAMTCGVPVLATPVGIVPDLLKNLPAGRQAAQGGEIISWEPEDIARKATGLLNDSEKYQKYSRSGQEIAGQFEKKAAIKNYADKLQNLI